MSAYVELVKYGKGLGIDGHEPGSITSSQAVTSPVTLTDGAAGVIVTARGGDVLASWGTATPSTKLVLNGTSVALSLAVGDTLTTSNA